MNQGRPATRGGVLCAAQVGTEVRGWCKSPKAGKAASCPRHSPGARPGGAANLNPTRGPLRGRGVHLQLARTGAECRANTAPAPALAGGRRRRRPGAPLNGTPRRTQRSPPGQARPGQAGLAEAKDHEAQSRATLNFEGGNTVPVRVALAPFNAAGTRRAESRRVKRRA